MTESELNRDMSEWSVYDEPTPSQDQDQDDYYIHSDDQPEKTYLLFTGIKINQINIIFKANSFKNNT